MLGPLSWAMMGTGGAAPRPPPVSDSDKCSRAEFMERLRAGVLRRYDPATNGSVMAGVKTLSLAKAAEAYKEAAAAKLGNPALW